ncbi:hypothetical protein [Streptomyces antibioticus]|uniref:Uncharacterized protein n=1 Tax=Streptomyces antibioticus TaxID=1890 RepID=A0AAE6YH21_STRAT|nr:hypothetical protein [Streptomyces antibioticus]MBO7939262.1 hypothetical protein [Streptomyces sp. S9]QIT48624.1 hypothetical protein HCX60_38200 [Streptomyces antibioticus]
MYSENCADAMFQPNAVSHSRFAAGWPVGDADETAGLFRRVPEVAQRGGWPRLMTAADLGALSGGPLHGCGNPGGLAVAAEEPEEEPEVARQPPGHTEQPGT